MIFFNGILKSFTYLNHYVGEFVFLIAEKNLNFSPGQFVMIEINNGDEKKTNRCYSVVKYDQEKGEITLCIGHSPNENSKTNWLFSKKIGDELKISAFYGKFSLKNQKEKLCFLATGIGVPPVYCMLESILKTENKKEIKLYFGHRELKDIYYLENLEKLKQNHQNFSYSLCISREEYKGFKGYIQQKLETDDIDFASSEFYYCGSTGVLKSLKDFLYEKGVQKQDFIFEVF